MGTNRSSTNREAANRGAALGLSCLLSRHGWPLALPTGRMTPLEIWKSSDAALTALLKLPDQSAAKLLDFRRGFQPRDAFAELERKEIAMVALGDPGYPSCLSQIHDPPPALFLKGDPARLAEFMARPRAAIVGARRASRYGKDAARRIAEELSDNGVCVVSGMALGIDAAAHEGSLMAAGGAIAVLGCGVDIVYPRTNARLYRTIIENGLVISEYPPGNEPVPWRFPARNRIIAGLAGGVIVVEAKGKSGALITADFALEQGREVWAVPGSIFSDLSEGTHRLLRAGASAITSAFDVLEDMGIDVSALNHQPANAAARPPADLTGDERRLFDALDSSSAHPDSLAKAAKLSGARVSAALVSLELKGLARADDTGGYSR